MWRGPNRRSPRLRGFDYAQEAAYFVTVCTHGREPLFGEVVGGEMRLSEIGDIVWWEWHRSEWLRDEVSLDAFVVMPNHVHGVVMIRPPEPSPVPRGPVGTTRASSLRTPPAPGPAKRSLGAFVGAFKSAAAKRVHRRYPHLRVWQGRYYDTVLRDERHLEAAREYIVSNPANWATDEENV
ncbi:Transposase IS200 like protein [Calidithermus terrae]|uniref:Transposase IS200 like protein n=1 Tax=Calidithermus terrae TaxID=1408545 RepID=A0A399DUZ1_9DEIN|nr:transposase [Calidithermus terrae]RIH74978.1 Transposase IS200 like protein [Calidithermus terrae]